MTKQTKNQPRNVATKLIESHLVAGMMNAGEEIGLKIDQTLTQDATGTLVMLELEAMGLSQVKTELSAQYVDHNLLQTDNRNPDDHLFLRSACERFGLWFSPAGSGVSHPVHMERFGKPGKTLLGSDSHTCAAGSLGMLAMGAGGLAVALAMCGEPFYLNMPKVMGVRLTGKLPAMMVKGRQVREGVSFDINPTSRQVLENLVELGHLTDLLSAGARLHQTGCNGCIGMGQAPATDQISLRTVPRNFAGRSGTREDKVCLCSPETATASALTGVITDPRDLDMSYPVFDERSTFYVDDRNIRPPAKHPELTVVEKGPNISTLPKFEALPDSLKAPVLLKVGDDVSTDDILPAGSRILPFRSNIPAISEFTYTRLDPTYPERAKEYQDTGSLIVGGDNYGQGSSREHAALAPRYLGVRAVIAKSYSRIHWQNLSSFGVLPLSFVTPENFDSIEQGDELSIEGLVESLKSGDRIVAKNTRNGERYELTHELSERQVRMVVEGGLLNMMRQELAA